MSVNLTCGTHCTNTHCECSREGNGALPYPAAFCGTFRCLMEWEGGPTVEPQLWLEGLLGGWMRAGVADETRGTAWCNSARAKTPHFCTAAPRNLNRNLELELSFGKFSLIPALTGTDFGDQFNCDYKWNAAVSKRPIRTFPPVS